jgi:small-conductance mechanosensitive channel
MQSRKASLFESAINVACGYLLALVTQAVVLPLFGFQIDLRQNALIAATFTVISLVRQYVVRRLFNQFTLRQNGYTVERRRRDASTRSGAAFLRRVK